MSSEKKSSLPGGEQSFEHSAPPPYSPSNELYGRPDSSRSIISSAQFQNYLQPSPWYQDTSTHALPEAYSPAQTYGSPQRPAFSSALSPENSSRQGLQRPIAIPAVTKKMDAPFIRAYPPVLMQYQLPEEVFLPIIDRLNQLATVHPPLAALELAGDIVGMVPEATAQIVGTSVSAAATISAAAVAKGRSELYLRQINKDVFLPRGLKAKLVKLDTLAKLSGMPILTEDGEIDKKAALLAPLEGLEQDLTLESSARRLNALEPWIQPLRIHELPKVERPRNVFSRFAADTQAKSQRKGEEKLLKERAKAHEEYMKEYEKKSQEFDEKMQEIDKKEDKSRNKGDDKQLRQLEKERMEVLKEWEKERTQMEEDRLENDKEEQALRKAYFLLIRSVSPSRSPSRSPWLRPIA